MPKKNIKDLINKKKTAKKADNEPGSESAKKEEEDVNLNLNNQLSAE